MPKKSSAAPAKVLTPRQVSRWQKERRRQRITILVGSAIIAVIVGVLGYGFFTSRIAPRWEPAVRVNNTTVNMQYLANYLRMALGGQRKSDADTVQSIAPLIVEEIQNSQIIKEAAAGMGVSVSDDEVNEAIRDSAVTPDEKGKIGEEEIQQRLRRRINTLKVPESFFREVVTNTVLRKKMQEKLESQIPTQGEQVKLSVILLDTDIEANEVRAKLESGSDFAAVAKESSKDDATKEKGGDLGWAPRGLYPDLEAAAFGLSTGELSQPIATPRGYFILLATDRQNDRPIDEDTLKAMKSRALSNWVEEARKQHSLENLLVDKDTGRVQPKRLTWLLQQLSG
ncbi:MAG: peptidylprolyl isomerase [Chloroflexi bacterium]|nr:peptidylprolyl isomerase [Chloroflexota bacterium]